VSDKTVSSEAMSNEAMSSESVSNKTVSSETVSNEAVSSKTVSSVDKGSSMGDSVVGNGVGNGVNERGGVGNGVVSNRDSLRVGSSSGVGDLGDVTINVVGVVVDGLDTAVGKVHRVGALNNTGAIVALGLAEGSLGVVVGNPIVVGVGGDLGQITGSVASDGGGVGNSVDHRGSVDNRGVMDNRGSMDGMGEGVGNHGGSMDSVVGNRVGKSMASVGNYWSGVGNSMGNWVSHMGSQGSNSSMSDRDRPVGSDGRLDLREALGVVSLSD